MNNFTTARSRPPVPDPFRFLERLPRDVWQIAFCRFHSSVRRTDAHPAEVIAWVWRDLKSTLADMDRMDRLPHEHPLRGCVCASAHAFHVEALLTLGQAMQRHPEEAAAFAEHALHVEFGMELRRSMRERAAR